MGVWPTRIFITIWAHYELPQKITTLLADLSQLDSLARAGRKKAEKFHTWKERAQEIIQHVQMLDGFRALKG